MAKTAAQPKTMESNHKVASVLSTGLFAILCVLIAFPLLAGFFASFQEGREVVMKGMSLNLDFSKMHLDNYKYLFSGNEDSRKYFMWYKNSLILTLITVVLTLLACYFIAYGLTMYKFKLQGFLFFLVIATMCVPFEILMLPLYNEVTSLGIINTRAGVILPGLCGASTIFFFKQYMQSLPKELLDAGRIDGCTEYGISVKITDDNKIRLNFHVIVAYGVNISTIADNLVNNVKYKVEAFTGMEIEKIKIMVEGVRAID